MMDTLDAQGSASTVPLTTISGATDVHRDRLTSREREVLRLLRGRLSDREIAELLYISTRTVESHVGNILGKLAVTNRRDAATIAVHLELAPGIPLSRHASTSG